MTIFSLARWLAVCAAVSPLAVCHAQAPPPPVMVDADTTFGKLRLVDEVACGNPSDTHEFSEMPARASRVETLLGVRTRVLPNIGDAKYFAYRVGKGKNLQSGKAYVLAVTFPEDKARSLFIVNRGAESVRGVRTGNALGDVLHSYTNSNSESLAIPLSKKSRTWKNLFFLHDRFYELGLTSDEAGKPGKARGGKPSDGFWVAVTQSKATNDPTSNGAAAASIRLYEVVDEAKLTVPLRLPPAGLPRRHLFWREEMGDAVIEPEVAEERGVARRVDYYDLKARLMRFLGMNTFSKDLLEFGHNQGWDSGATNDWYNASRYPQLWGDIVGVAAKYNFDILPYYEYAGSVGQKGLGGQKRAMPLSGAKDYTHVSWTEGNNVDVTDPETLADAKKLLDATIIRYKAQARFVGAWFRPRPSQMPIGFADATLVRFAADANAGQLITRQQLQSDAALLARYHEWWFGKRQAFLLSLRNYLRGEGIADAAILFTPDASEPGRSLLGQHAIVSDTPALWEPILKDPAHSNLRVVSYAQTVAGNSHGEALTSPTPTWGQWEWQHADPQADAANYRKTSGVLLTYSFHPVYSVSSPAAFAPFRTATGLAAVQHFPLNERTLEKSLGYLASDTEYAGSFCMLPEARAMANGDPRYLGYLSASNFNRGFPEYVRAFNAAFLSLPALPSAVLPNAAPDPAVVVRMIKTPAHGTYFAIVNTGLTASKTIITLPVRGKITDATTGKIIANASGKLALTLYPCELRALHIK
ncbi:MAG: hypothetical protein H7Y38_04705 [Armatimonadetes bacterium]|nr:hypothetical protein [Armatimonadota bacterium]